LRNTQYCQSDARSTQQRARRGRQNDRTYRRPSTAAGSCVTFLLCCRLLLLIPPCTRVPAAAPHRNRTQIHTRAALAFPFPVRLTMYSYRLWGKLTVPPRRRAPQEAREGRSSRVPSQQDWGGLVRLPPARPLPCLPMPCHAMPWSVRWRGGIAVANPSPRLRPCQPVCSLDRSRHDATHPPAVILGPPANEKKKDR
jgi:hypothetical protein